MEFIEKYFLWFMIYSILGWIYETLICSAEQQKFINRGFLNGPYCPIYGCGAIIDIIFLENIRNYIILFLAGMFLTCSLEYFTSWGMEKLFHARWWDYSDRKLNINGRVCLLGGVVFGTFSVILIKFLHLITSWFTYKISEPVLLILSLILFISILVDAVYTVARFAKFEKKLKKLTNGMDNAIQTANQYKKVILYKISESEIYEKASAAYISILGKINSQERRMILAFPRFRSTRYNDALQKIKEAIKRKN
jgi:uncharacterized membrane protein